MSWVVTPWSGLEMKRKQKQNTTPMIILKYWKIETSHTVPKRFSTSQNCLEICTVPISEQC